MVVETLDAAATDRAVPASSGADSFTLSAQLGALANVEKVHEVDAIVSDVPWIFVRSQGEEKESEREEGDAQQGCPDRYV